MTGRGGAVVTGAARGIGAATARRLHEDGYAVVALDLDGDALAQAWAGEEVACVVGDAADPAAIEDAIAAAPQPLRVYVANAGATRNGPAIGYPRVEWDRLLEVHLTGAFEGARHAAAAMGEAGGSIVCTASIAALQGFAARPAYSAAKAGIVGLVRSLAVEWAPRGIRVNAVVPGYVATDIVRETVRRGFVDEAALRRRIPLGRLGEPAQIADAIAFLASERAAYVTGVALPVDGGWSAFGLGETTDA